MDDNKLVGPFPASVPPAGDEAHIGLYRVQIETPASDDGLSPVTVEQRTAYWNGMYFVLDNNASTVIPLRDVIQWWGQPIPPAGHMAQAVNALLETQEDDGLNTDDELEVTSADSAAIAAHLASITGQEGDGL